MLLLIYKSPYLPSSNVDTNFVTCVFCKEKSILNHYLNTSLIFTSFENNSSKCHKQTKLQPKKMEINRGHTKDLPPESSGTL